MTRRTLSVELGIGRFTARPSSVQILVGVDGEPFMEGRLVDLILAQRAHRLLLRTAEGTA